MSDDDSFRDRIRAELKNEEGCVTHMYLDTRGYVTVGVGHMLADVQAAQVLGFRNRASGEPATPEEIENAFNTVKQQPPGRIASRYQTCTDLELPMEEIDAQLDRHIDDFETTLRGHFRDYDQFPPEARQALLDMAFNLGSSGLLKKFPKLVANARARNWEGCAVECERRGIGDARNEATRALFNKATQRT